MDVSILVPARNEEWLARTIQDLNEHCETDYEIIAILDGQWAEPPIEDHPRVTLLYYPESIGQRAATNRACEIAQGKYIIKCDAHCAFDQGFDRKLVEAMQDDWTVVPTMRNLHIFDWVCPDGHRRYQGPSGPCSADVDGKPCGKATTKQVVWNPKRNPQSKSYCFDSTPHFQYFKAFNSRPEGQGELTDTMSLQGSFFMLTKERYKALNICDESFGSWGSQGIEVACKTWLSGGRVVVNQRTWYAHCFRTQGGDFSFPYDLSGRQVERAKRHAKKVFFENKWPGAKKPLSWLVEKFWPIPGWKQEDLDRLKASET